jgi:hypothetical protein
MITDKEYKVLLEKCRELPPAEDHRVVDDFIENLLLTVLDYQIEQTKLNKAMDYYRARRRQEIREFADLQLLLSKNPDDKRGNTRVARYLWNNYSWNRVGLLRKLAAYFEAEEINSQDQLKDWAQYIRFEDFQGKVTGMGYVLYQKLIMRQGLESIKPETHVVDFVNSVIDRYEADLPDIGARLTAAAKQLKIPADELNRRIWECQMGVISSGQMTVKT